MSTTCILCVTIPCTNHEKKDLNTNTHKPEVVSAISLTKTTARNEADPGVLQKFHTVEHVWSLTLRLYSHTHNKSWTKSIRPSRIHEHTRTCDTNQPWLRWWHVQVWWYEGRSTWLPAQGYSWCLALYSESPRSVWLFQPRHSERLFAPTQDRERGMKKERPG